MDEMLFRNAGEFDFSEPPDYGRIKGIERVLDVMSDIEPHNSFITDYYKKRIHFMSLGASRLCGYSKEELSKYGQEFFKLIIPEEDLAKMRIISDVGLERFYTIPVEDRMKCSMSYDFVLQRKDGRRVCLNRRIRPFYNTEEGKLWLSISCVNYSFNDKIGDVIFNELFRNKRYQYSFEKNQWKELPPVDLTENEKVTAIELYRGSIDKQIANMLYVSKDTISYYKKQLMVKTNKPTIKGALDYLFYNCII